MLFLFECHTRARWNPIIQGYEWACPVEGNGGMAFQIFYSTPSPEPFNDDGGRTTTRTDPEDEDEWKYHRVECMNDSGGCRGLDNVVARETLPYAHRLWGWGRCA